METPGNKRLTTIERCFAPLDTRHGVTSLDRSVNYARHIGALADRGRIVPKGLSDRSLAIYCQGSIQ
jgi:hypothetical protein